MSIFDLFKLSFGALKDRKVRTILTILMVVVGATLIVGLNGLSAGFSTFIDKQFSVLTPNMLIITPSPQFQRGGGTQTTPMNIDDRLVKSIEPMNGVRGVVPVILKTVNIDSGSSSRNVQVIGMDQTKIDLLFPTFSLEEGTIVFPYDSVGILLGNEVKYPPGKSSVFAGLGERVTIDYKTVDVSNGNQNWVTHKKSFLVRGTVNPLGTGGFIPIDRSISMSLSEANYFFNMERKYSMAFVITEGIVMNGPVEKEIRKIYGDDIGISSPRVIVQTIQGFVSGFTGFIMAIAAVSLIVAGVGIVTTLITSVMERTREIGLLKAIGFRGRTIMTLFLTEAVLIGAIGGVLGIALGIALGTVLPTLFPGGPDDSGVVAVFHLESLIGVWILVTSLSAIAGIYPAWRASKLDPVEALRKE